MKIICLDFEGVLVPEIWINVANKTRIDKLRLTTRDIPDYDKLMKERLKILKEHNLKLKDIQDVIKQMKPLEGAKEFLDWLRERFQVIIISDTFNEFAHPLLAQLNWPTIFCNSLIIGENGDILDYRLRQKDGKRKAVEAIKSIGFEVMVVGDSYNDISMLKVADKGILFCPPKNIILEFSQFPITKNYTELKKEILK